MNKTELERISVPVKKIELEMGFVELRPFKQKHFATAIALIHKYFDCYNLVKTDYAAKREKVFKQYEDNDALRAEAIFNFDEAFNEPLEIAKKIMHSAGQGISEDLKTIVEISILRSYKIVEQDGTKEKVQFEIDLDELTWGECLMLVATVVGLNMDFFNQNVGKIDLLKVSKDEENPSPKPNRKDGEESLAA